MYTEFIVSILSHPEAPEIIKELNDYFDEAEQEYQKIKKRVWTEHDVKGTANLVDCKNVDAWAFREFERKIKQKIQELRVKHGIEED
ncbi:hypothetical protein KAR91_07540 [Candidatus Pacearchaeota archaeon]|nr:hypothetical protein [Candidatus Pacearchaeota archaeon]